MTQPPTTADEQRWRDPSAPVAERVDALLAAMTLEEKVGQLGSRWVGSDLTSDDATEDDRATAAEQDEAETQNVAPMQDVFATVGIPFHDTLGVHTKSRCRNDHRPYHEVLSEQQAFAQEIAPHGHRS